MVKQKRINFQNIQKKKCKTPKSITMKEIEMVMKNLLLQETPSSDALGK